MSPGCLEGAKMLVQDLPAMSSSCLGEGEDGGADDLFRSFLQLVAL